MTSSPQRRADLVEAHAHGRLKWRAGPLSCASRAPKTLFCHYFATPEVRELWRMPGAASVLLLKDDRAPAAAVDDGVFEDQPVSI